MTVIGFSFTAVNCSGENTDVEELLSNLVLHNYSDFSWICSIILRDGVTVYVPVWTWHHIMCSLLVIKAPNKGMSVGSVTSVARKVISQV